MNDWEYFLEPVEQCTGPTNWPASFDWPNVRGGHKIIEDRQGSLHFRSSTYRASDAPGRSREPGPREADMAFSTKSRHRRETGASTNRAKKLILARSRKSNISRTTKLVAGTRELCSSVLDERREDRNTSLLDQRVSSVELLLRFGAFARACKSE
jgi:hypothetical protein